MIRGIHSKCNPLHDGEIRGWHTPNYEITPSYFSSVARDLFIYPYDENSIIKINNTNKKLLWL